MKQNPTTIHAWDKRKIPSRGSAIKKDFKYTNKKKLHKSTPKPAVEEPKVTATPEAKRNLPTLQLPASMPTSLTPKQDLLSWHLRLGHIPFGILTNMARVGILPQRLAKVQDNPKCPSCQYGQAHRRPWRRHKTKSTIKPANAPGDCVSVDQLQSTVPGIIAQDETNQKYRLTKRRFKYATVFVDHFSRLSFVYVHETTDADDAINKFDELFYQVLHCIVL